MASSCPSLPQPASSAGGAISTPLLLGAAAAAHVATCLALDRHVRLGADDEAAYWRSDLLAEWQRAYDGVFAGAAVVVQVSFLRKLAPASPPSSPWADRMAWHWLLQLVLLAALCQLAAAVAAPRLYRRHRLRWAVAMRLLRLATNSMQVWASSAHNPMRLGWHNIVASVRERPAAARSLLFGWSGASLGVMQSVMAPLPLRGVASMNLLLLILLVGVHSGSVALELLHPAVLPSYQRLCAPVPRALGNLASAAAGAWCARHVQLVVAAVQLLGCTMPVAVMALVERAMKDIYLKGRVVAAHDVAAMAAAASVASGQTGIVDVGPGGAAGGGTADGADGDGIEGGGDVPMTDWWLEHRAVLWLCVAMVVILSEWAP